MPFIIEIKARTEAHAHIRACLQAEGADFRGTDTQRDTYFRVPQGRLKLRQGRIEKHLIYYQRPDQAGPKPSQVQLYRPADDAALHALLSHSLGVWQVVEKKREIYFIGHIKFHLDTVPGLGTFVEIEAIDEAGTLSEARLRADCAYYMQRFGIQEADLIDQSYSDLLFAQNKPGAKT
ncbi:MAG: CYTH domain-containing protein [Bacteroidetes bacterium]|nr:MAG: CYTH domain-containing protein [Bacteroidota bacterium]